MNRVEIQGWLSLLVAVVGLYLTATNGTETANAIASLSIGGELPPEFAGAQGAIRVFLFLISMVVFGALFFVGLGILLAHLFRAMGASMPHHAAFTFLATLLVGTVTLTLGIFGHLLWIIGGLGTLVLAVSTGLAAVEDDEGGGYWAMMIGGGAIALVCGCLVTMFVAIGSQPPSASAAAATTDANAVAREAAQTAAAPTE